MAKFCGSCGNEVMDNAVVCPHCNAQLTSAAPQQNNGQAAPAFDLNAIKNQVTSKAKGIDPKILKIGVAAIAAVVVIIVVISIIVSASNNYKSAVKNLFNYREADDIKVIEKLAPPAYWEYQKEENDFDISDEDELADRYEESLEATRESLEDEYGEKIKISYKITDDKKLSDKKVKDLADLLKDNYDIPKKSVTKVYEVEIDYEIKGSDDEDEDDIEIYVAKIDGKWYPVTSSGTFYIY